VCSVSYNCVSVGVCECVSVCLCVCECVVACSFSVVCITGFVSFVFHLHITKSYVIVIRVPLWERCNVFFSLLFIFDSHTVCSCLLSFLISFLFSLKFPFLFFVPHFGAQERYNKENSSSNSSIEYPNRPSLSWFFALIYLVKIYHFWFEFEMSTGRVEDFRHAGLDRNWLKNFLLFCVCYFEKFKILFSYA